VRRPGYPLDRAGAYALGERLKDNSSIGLSETSGRGHNEESHAVELVYPGEGDMLMFQPTSAD